MRVGMYADGRWRAQDECGLRLVQGACDAGVAAGTRTRARVLEGESGAVDVAALAGSARGRLSGRSRVCVLRLSSAPTIHRSRTCIR